VFAELGLAFMTLYCLVMCVRLSLRVRVGMNITLVFRLVHKGKFGGGQEFCINFENLQAPILRSHAEVVGLFGTVFA
jgi:hypothetical protein